MARNDFSNIPADVQKANVGKWVVFISKDYLKDAPMITEIIASDISLEKCFEDNTVKSAIQQIANSNSSDAVISHNFPKI